MQNCRTLYYKFVQGVNLILLVTEGRISLDWEFDNCLLLAFMTLQKRNFRTVKIKNGQRFNMMNWCNSEFWKLPIMLQFNLFWYQLIWTQIRFWICYIIRLLDGSLIISKSIYYQGIHSLSIPYFRIKKYSSWLSDYYYYLLTSPT